MFYTAAIVVLTICTFQSLLVFIGNTFTVFVFWIHRNKLKRTSVLLINLAVADLLVGFTQTVINITLFSLSQHIGGRANEISYRNIPNLFPAFIAAFMGVSMFFLALISLERAFALIWPLRHRSTSTKTYMYNVVLVWLAGIIPAALMFLAFYGIVEYVYCLITFSGIIVLCLVTICLSYLAIRKRLNDRGRAIDATHNRQSVEQNKKLSKTIFVVIGASAGFWIPSLVFFCIYYFYAGLPAFANYIFALLTLGNSLVNPVIYSLRMPVFRETLKRLSSKLRIRKQSKTYIVSGETRK